MVKRIFTAVVLAVAALTACSEKQGERGAYSASDATDFILKSGGTDNVAVYAFRQSDEGAFVYETVYKDGWNSDGIMSVRLRNGRYRFLFAGGESDALAVRTPLSVGVTRWEDTEFSLRERSGEPGVYDGAGELFLQYPSTDAERVYTAGGTDITVSALLTRAVGRIRVALKRGYRSGDTYVEVPYTGLQNILDEISGIEFKALNAGKTVGIAGTSGSAVVTAVLDLSGQGTVSDKGFASIDGPFVLPPAGGTELDMELKVLPAAGSPIGSTVLSLAGKAARNNYLHVTLWITSGFPEVGVEIRTEPIDKVSDGDSGVWE